MELFINTKKNFGFFVSAALTIIFLFSFHMQVQAMEAKKIRFGANNQFNGYLAVPDNQQKNAAAIVMIHEWFGLTADIEQMAERYAEMGYVVLAVDLYDGKIGKNSDEARALATAVRENVQAAFANLEAAVDYLKGYEAVQPDKIAALGWCFGGGWSYQMAKNNLGVRVAVMYYGRFSPDDDLSKMKTSILGHFAQEDRSIKLDDVKQFEINLKNHGAPYAIYIYPNTTHGFASREGINPNFDEQSAKQAWDRTQAFLQKNLFP